MVVRLQLRHDTYANWYEANPILLNGEIAVETDSNRMKIGTGNRWRNTEYYDKYLVHITGNEDIRGEKTFLDDIVMGSTDPNGDVEVTINGDLKVTNEIDGVVYRAYQDGDGNTITDYYQKKITDNDTIVEGIDWNTVIVEGTYGVDVNNWNYNEYHDPSGFDANIGQAGMLVIHEDKEGHIVQRYKPMTANALNTVVSRYRTVGGSWSSWVSENYYDETVVHSTGLEEIDGTKVFKQVMKSENGTINLSADKDDMDAGQTAKLQRAGDTFLRRESNGEIYLSSSNANIYIRPNGDNETNGQIVINNNGVLDGKCLRDGQGRIISDTYATTEDLKSLSLKEPTMMNRADDSDTYDAISDRKLANFGTFTDMIKANNFGTQGTALTITDGVAMGFTNSDYVTITIPTATTDYLCIKGAFIPGTDLTGLQYVFYGDANNFFRITVNSLEAKIAGVTFSAVDLTFVSGDYYTFMIRLNPNEGVLYLNNEQLITSSTASSIGIAGLATIIGTDGTNPFKGAIDLNAFRVFVDYDRYDEEGEDVPIYQPCLYIPYTLSKFGVKIVDGVYADRTVDCYNQFRTGNYFIFDEDNQQFRLPFDSPNGLNHTLFKWRSGKDSCEYDTNLECIQTGACTNGTPVIFKKPFADNSYNVDVNCTTKTATGFTPSETKDSWIAKGQITLDENMN